MRRVNTVLIIGTAAILMAVVGYVLVLAVEPNSTVCHGTATIGYCDTHAGHWAIVGLIAGLIIGGAVASALVLRSKRSHSV